MFLSYYSRTNSEVALLAINTMHRDCGHTNPIIRGMALRSLSSLGVPNLVEYIVPMILKGLKDDAPYVRKTAAISTIKLYHISPAKVLGIIIIKEIQFYFFNSFM